MGCCICRSLSRVPDVFHAEAKLVASGRGFFKSTQVMLYIKNNKLYQASPHCGLLCCSTSQRLSKIKDTTIVTGTVKLLDYQEIDVVHVHHINRGLKITFSKWCGETVKIYDLPDAVELAKRVDHNFRGEVVPTKIDITFKESPPDSDDDDAVLALCAFTVCACA